MADIIGTFPVSGTGPGAIPAMDEEGTIIFTRSKSVITRERGTLFTRTRDSSAARPRDAEYTRVRDSSIERKKK